MSLASDAEYLADEAITAGQAAATVVASCWQAGVDPEVTHNLVGAAVALGSNPLARRRDVDPMPDDRTYMDACEELFTHVKALLGSCRQLRGHAGEVLAAAVAAQQRAQAALTAARADGNPEAAQAASAAASAAASQAADAEACIDVCDMTGPRLAYATTRLYQVPDDLAETYGAAYRLVRAGRTLPHSGDWFTGATPADLTAITTT